MSEQNVVSIDSATKKSAISATETGESGLSSVLADAGGKAANDGSQSRDPEPAEGKLGVSNKTEDKTEHRSEVQANKSSNSEDAVDVVLSRFMRTIDDFRDAFMLGIPALADKRQEQLDNAREKLSRFPVKKLESSDTGVKVLFENPHGVSEFLDTLQEIHRLRDSRLLEVAMRGIYIGAFSEFDAFMGSLLKTLYSGKAELLRGISREVSLADLTKFDSLDAVKKDLLEKEVDSFRRESYVEQFGILERKFGIKTLRAFPEWAEFVEISQRRNLVTHNGGCVSQQYVAVCSSEGYKFECEPAVGQELKLSPKYVLRTLFLLQKIGAMLAHTLWRKVYPECIQEAQEALNTMIYELLRQRHWSMAAELGEFSLTSPVKHDIKEVDLRIRVINTAIGLKFWKKADRCRALLDSFDWSASIREFKLAVAILNERYSDASKIMVEIGKTGEIVNQLAYHRWPLFREMRDQSEFHDAYREIYGTEFVQEVGEGKDGERLFELIEAHFSDRQNPQVESDAESKYL